MSEITVNFEFELGDMVYFKSAQHSLGKRPLRFVVYERLAQQCHGGIQRLYKLGTITELVPEILLRNREPEYSKRCDAEIEERFAMMSEELLVGTSNMKD